MIGEEDEETTLPLVDIFVDTAVGIELTEPTASEGLTKLAGVEFAVDILDEPLLVP